MSPFLIPPSQHHSLEWHLGRVAYLFQKFVFQKLFDGGAVGGIVCEALRHEAFKVLAVLVTLYI